MRAPYVYLITFLLSLTALVDAAAQRASGQAEESEVQREHRPRRATVKLMRWEAAVGTGLTAAVLTGIPQAGPTLQTSFGYTVSPRITIGAAFAQATFAPRPYVDQAGVASYERNLSRHFGLRVKGVMLRRGITSVYGGLQLGVTTSKFSYEHEFPASLQIEDEASYLEQRPSPFFDPGSQVGAIGFVGVSLRVLRHVEVYTELGNNLSLLSCGTALVF